MKLRSVVHPLVLLLALPLCHALATPPGPLGPEAGLTYPWSFNGRLWFRPAFVRVPTQENKKPSPPESVSILSLFGWTIGGVVALEYDDSPVGPYCEYVTMGAVVSKRGALGQWGSRLYVSNSVAKRICDEIWKVPAEVAHIEFLEESSIFPSLGVSAAPDPVVNSLEVEEIARERQPFFSFFGNKNDPISGSTGKPRIVVEGWKNTRTLENPSDCDRKGGIPILWTPSIKALWAPFVPFPPSDSNATDKLPLHRLRLSASAFKFHFCWQHASDLLGVPVPIGLSVDNVLIEIGPQFDEL